MRLYVCFFKSAIGDASWRISRRDSPVQTGVHEDVVFPISVCDKWPNLFMREVSPREGARRHGLGSPLPELVRISLLAAHVHQ